MCARFCELLHYYQSKWILCLILSLWRRERSRLCKQNSIVYPFVKDVTCSAFVFYVIYKVLNIAKNSIHLPSVPTAAWTGILFRFPRTDALVILNCTWNIYNKETGLNVLFYNLTYVCLKIVVCLLLVLCVICLY